jgi:uncharacterized protein YkuJ
MDIIAGIGAATEGLKLINELRKIDKELDKAELKLRLVDVADKLLDSKQALQDAHERELALLQSIKGLEKKLVQRASHKDENGLLYAMSKTGERVGEPFCNLCYVKEEKFYRLRYFEASTARKAHYLCDNCKTLIVTGPALPSPSPKPTRYEKPWIR